MGIGPQERFGEGVQPGIGNGQSTSSVWRLTGTRLPDLRLPEGWRGWRKGAQMWGRRGGAELGVCAGGSARRGYDRTNGMRGGGPD